MTLFQLIQTDGLENVFEGVNRFEDHDWIFAGEQDSLDWFGDRAKRPSAVIEMSGISELNGLRETHEGIENGALTSLNDFARNPLIIEKLNLLPVAARRVASLQICTFDHLKIRDPGDSPHG
ncbi:MAG: FAD binding domain-containing protein [Woeseiaceae bacterium]|nr:FAD binding domain-containing protein [Woeseiaceae bacterium]